MNRRSSVESAQTTSKPVSDVAPGISLDDACLRAETASGIEAGAILSQALTLNCGNLRRRWQAKGASPKGEADSSEAPSRDGAVRSSVETAAMAEERRDGVIWRAKGDQPGDREESSVTCKSYDIPKTLVWEAWLRVKANHGAAGIDAETIERFEAKLAASLYRLWNRMSSGSYFPPPVKAVPIPKKSGGVRVLGVPTVTDRDREDGGQDVARATA